MALAAARREAPWASQEGPRPEWSVISAPPDSRPAAAQACASSHDLELAPLV